MKHVHTHTAASTRWLFPMLDRLPDPPLAKELNSALREVAEFATKGL